MKNILSLSVICLSSISYCQFAEGFNDLFDTSGTSSTLGLESRGWVLNNRSSALGNTGWFGNGSVFASHSGAGYVAANYENISGVGTISNWLISPNVTLKNGDTFSYWTRTSSAVHPDRLEVRLSTNGTSTNVGTTDTSFGDFSTLLQTVNPNLLGGSANYPTTWTLHTVTVSGLAAPTSGRFAFRYFVTLAGVGAANGEYIGIDDVSYTPTTNKTISGTLNLSGYTGSTTSLQFVYELRDASTNALIETQTISGLGTGNSFSLTTTQNAGNYKLRIKGASRFLAKSATITLDAGGVSGLSYTLLNGDSNGDNIVGTADFNILRNAWGAIPSSPNWNESADLDGDGVVGTLDFIIQRNNWGAIGDS